MAVLLRLTLPRTVVTGSNTKLVACGDDPFLGHWDPKRAPGLVRTDGGDWVLESAGHGTSRVRPGAEFKYVLLDAGGQVQWEANRPNRKWRSAGDLAPAPLHHFDQLEDYEAPLPVSPVGSVERQHFHASVVSTGVALRLLLPPNLARRTGAQVVACGDDDFLGHWDPKRAPKLNCVGDEWVLQLAPVTNVRPSAEFKYVLMDSSGHMQWEANRPNRQWQQLDGSVHHFDKVEAKEGGQSAYLQTPAASSGAPPLAPAALVPPAEKSSSSSKTRRDPDVSSVGAVLRVSVPSTAGDGRHGASVVACGDAELLGYWDPVKAVKLIHSGDGDEWVLPASFAEEAHSVRLGAEFKYVVMEPSGRVQWEANRPNRLWTPPLSATDVPELQQFDELSAEEAVEFATALASRALPRRKRDKARTPLQGDELRITWGKADTPGGLASFKKGRPGLILHAFHSHFQEVKKWAEAVEKGGYDAVQISPAQRSIHGDQWWTRYQPVRYSEIHGLGSERDLRELCAEYAKRGIQVLGDLVFNHMLVVGSCYEWKEAQKDTARHERLVKKLEAAVAPDFDRDDFQWPWFPLEGAEWDGPMRMEGWGSGEWSELKGGAPKVVKVHTAHMQLLRSCGVSGFRLDAAKHMRPQHVVNYAAIAQTLPTVGKAGADGAFFYGEVLSSELLMHREYQDAKPSSEFRSDAWEDEPLSTTDFLLPVWLRHFLETGESNTAESLTASKSSAKSKTRAQKRILSGTVEVPLVARNSVRFARNHDTAYGDQPYFGLSNWAPASAALATAWIMAAHDGAVLVLGEDTVSSKIIQYAALYRAALRKRLLSLPPVDLATVTTEISARHAEEGGPPVWVCVACRIQHGKGAVVGFCVLNPDLCEGPPVSFEGSTALANGGAANFLPVSGDFSKPVSLRVQGTLSEAVTVLPGSGAFFLSD